MDALMKLSREVQIVLGGAVLYLIFSFFDWQQVSYLGVSAGRSEWSGIGVIAGLLVLVLLAWEAVRLFEVKIELGSLTPGLVSVGLALLLLVFTVITFLSHNEARHWPAWIGLLLSIVIAVFAVKRAQGEGVEMPSMPKSMSGTTGSGSTTGSAPPTPPPSSSSEVPRSSDPTADA
jgi:hypothetical protein